MTGGIIYYNMGTKNLARLCVSLHTLRQVCDAPVTVLCADSPPQWFRRIVSDHRADILEVNLDGVSALTGKASLWRHSPYQATLYMDADTTVWQDPSDLIPHDGPGFMTTRFSDWGTEGGRIAKRINDWAPVLTKPELDAALAYGPAVNTGVVAWRKNSPVLPVWEKKTREGWDKQCLNRMVDELACQVILPQFKNGEVKIQDDLCNYSPKFSTRRYGDRPVIVHHHGYKHVHPYPECVFWRCMWHKLRRKYGAEGLPPDGDKRLTEYVETYPEDLTLCTVVNHKYAKKFNEQSSRWVWMDGLRGRRMIVFRVGNADINPPEGATVVDLPDTPKGMTDREYCLSQYVYGPAEHVKTSHWMKLDADCQPKSYEFILPRYEGYAIAAHRWGYTRVKGDDNAAKHWLNTLDDWYWGGPAGYPADIGVGERYKHDRFNSYCAIYQTAFTKQVAERCGERLPVPSEDTTTHYLAEQWQLPVLRYNAKGMMAQ